MDFIVCYCILTLSTSLQTVEVCFFGRQMYIIIYPALRVHVHVASFPGLPPHARNVTRKKIAKLGEGLVRNIT